MELLTEEQLEEGTIEYIKTNTDTIMSRGKKEESCRILYMLPYKMAPEDTNDICKLYEIISKLEELTSAHKAKNIHVMTMGNFRNESGHSEPNYA